MTEYQRYRIPTNPAPPRAAHPSRFRVRVDRPRLAALLVRELVHYRADMPVVLSRPCMYGVFSGPVGGFAPREQLCVGCLRCTVQYPDMVQILPNPDRRHLGDSYFDPDKVDTIQYEAGTGRVPVRGAGYRGRFTGAGWDSMWTDMSEIVRPTRDGIHGREFISTAVDVGGRPSFLTLDSAGQPTGELPHSVSIPVPFLFDRLPRSTRTPGLQGVVVEAARQVQTRAFVPVHETQGEPGWRDAVIPVFRPEDGGALDQISTAPMVVALDGWGVASARPLRQRFPSAIWVIRVAFGESLDEWVGAGFRTFHLTADYHGETRSGFVLDAIRRVHESLVETGVREQITLIGSGGIIAAEHLPKAIVAGLDLVALDTALLIALQATCQGECRTEGDSVFEIPPLDVPWAVQRLANLSAAWRDQLLEVLGAMGLRDVRRLRGEIGRAMFQPDLEREAFAGIPGFLG